MKYGVYQSVFDAPHIIITSTGRRSGEMNAYLAYATRPGGGQDIVCPHIHRLAWQQFTVSGKKEGFVDLKGKSDPGTGIGARGGQHLLRLCYHAPQTKLRIGNVASLICLAENTTSILQYLNRLVGKGEKVLSDANYGGKAYLSGVI